MSPCAEAPPFETTHPRAWRNRWGYVVVSRGVSDQAIRMLDRGELVDAKLFSNMAAAQLALDKFVAAAMYAQKCTEADPAWWKGYW